MADATVFNAVIKAVDEASAPIREIAARVRGLGIAGVTLGEHWKGLRSVGNAAFGEVAHEAGRAARAIHDSGHPHVYGALAQHLHLIRGHFGKLTEAAKEFGGKVAEILPMVGALAGVGSVAGLAELVNHAAERASATRSAAVAAGLTARQYTELAYAAKVADVSVSQMGGSMFRLNERLGQAAAGKNKDVAGLLDHLHISLRNANGSTKSAVQILPELADAFAHTKDKAMAAMMAQKLFGRAGAELLPLLEQGSAGLAKLAHQSDRVNFTPAGAKFAGLEAFHRSMVSLTASVGAFTDSIGASLAPVLTPIVKEFSKWLTDSRGWISADIAGAVKSVADALHGVKIKPLVDDFKSFAKTVKAAWDDIGGMTTVAIVAGAVLGGKLVAGAISAAASIGGIVRSVTSVAGALGKGTPWGLAILGVGLLAAVIIDHWKPISKFFRELWAGVTSEFAKAWAYIKPIVNELESAVSWVRKSWVGREIGLGPSRGGHRAPPLPPAFAGQKWHMVQLPHGDGLFAPRAPKGGTMVVHNHIHAPEGTIVRSRIASGAGVSVITSKEPPAVGYSTPAGIRARF